MYRKYDMYTDPLEAPSSYAPAPSLLWAIRTNMTADVCAIVADAGFSPMAWKNSPTPRYAMENLVAPPLRRHGKMRWPSRHHAEILRTPPGVMEKIADPRGCAQDVHMSIA